MSFDSRAGRALRAVTGWLSGHHDGLLDCQRISLRRFSAERRQREQALLRAAVHLDPAERRARAEALFREQQAGFERQVAASAARPDAATAGFAAD
ncbi:MAG: hypothetical protein EXR79_00970 [Myxococcales bacterium]|nr:hypothetical protein [Myxococcales bacterium]